MAAKTGQKKVNNAKKLIKEMIMLPIYRQVEQSKARYNILYGSSSSGKSHWLRQYALKYALSHDHGMSMIVMLTNEDLKTAYFYPIIKMLNDYNIVFKSKEVGPMMITFENGHEMFFVNGDDPENFKSITDPGLAIVDEATKLREEVVFQMDNRLGRTGPKPKVILAFNPIGENNWCVKNYVLPHMRGEELYDCFVLKTTYQDNPYLSRDERNKLEHLIDRDRNWHRIYCLGEPGVLEGLIYIEDKNWTISPKYSWPSEIQMTPPNCVGLDFGFTHASAAIAIWGHDGSNYAEEVLYVKNTTRTELLQMLTDEYSRRGWDKTQIVLKCDSAEPGTIMDFKRAGFRTFAPKKNILDGIQDVKKYPLLVDSKSVNLIREFRTYIWVKDKDNELKDVPINKGDDCMAALRYACTPMVVESKAKENTTVALNSSTGNAIVEQKAVILPRENFRSPFDGKSYAQNKYKSPFR